MNISCYFDIHHKPTLSIRRSLGVLLEYSCNAGAETSFLYMFHTGFQLYENAIIWLIHLQSATLI
jgi:hypothetical protein